MTFWEVEKTIAFLAELVRLLFGQRLEKLGLHFISTSGHTVYNDRAVGKFCRLNFGFFFRAGSKKGKREKRKEKAAFQVENFKNYFPICFNICHIEP